MSKYQDLDAWRISMQVVKEIYEITSKYLKEELYLLNMGLITETIENKKIHDVFPLLEKNIQILN